MRLSFGKPSSSDSPDTINVPGGTFNHPITLTRAPLVETETATKSYVDNSITGLSTNLITDGVLASARLPAIGGDFVSAAGTNVIMYASTGVSGGWMSRVVLDNKGRVLEGGELQVEDYPEMDFSLFADGMPFNYRDYGITDVLDASGGTLVDNVRLVGDPADPYHAATKAYADAKAATGGGSGLSVGDIVGIYNPAMSDETGMLRCNGAQVDIAAYPDLYAKIGDASDASIKHGHGRPWEQQKGINTLQSVDITGWQTTNPLPGPRIYPLMFATKNRVYTTGGHTGAGFNATVHSAVINGDGTLGTWSVVGSTGFTNGPVQATASAIVVKDRVFIFGNNAGTGSAYSHAAINTDGTLGAFSGLVTVPFLPSKITFCLGNKIYVVRPEGVYRTEVSDSGDLSDWKLVSREVGRYNTGGVVAITKNRVYILGYYDTNGPVAGEALVAGYDQNGELFTWSSVTLGGPVIAQSPCCYVTNKTVYVLGSGAGYNKVDRIEVLPDGSLGNWTAGTDLPGYKTAAGLLATSSKLYLFGGASGGSPESTVFMGSITGGVNDFSPYYQGSQTVAVTVTYGTTAGSGQPWQQQYDINSTQSGALSNWTTVATLPNPLSSSHAFVTKNRIYTVGGIIDMYNDVTRMVGTYAVQADGSLGANGPDVLMPASVSDGRLITTGNRVYLIGGKITGNSSSTIYTATIGADGVVGEWTLTTPLPVALSEHQVFVTRDHLYVVGGITTSGYSQAVYMTELGPTGSIGSWSVAGALPDPRSKAQVAVTKNRVFLIGGFDGNVNVSTCLTAAINSNGTLGSWTVSSPLPVTVADSQVYVTKTRVYLLGGTIANTLSSAIYSASVDGSGALGSWSTVGNIPVAMTKTSLVATKDNLYLIGGSVNNEPVTTIYRTAISGGSNDYTDYDHLGTGDDIEYLYPGMDETRVTHGSGRPWEQQYHFNTEQAAIFGSTVQYGTSPIAMQHTVPVVTKNKVFLIGGEQASVRSAQVKRVQIIDDSVLNPVWENWNLLPKALIGHSVLVIAGAVYVLGGIDFNGAFSASVYRSVIDEDGDLGAWTEVVPLPTATAFMGSVVVGNHIHLYGGLRSGNVPTADCWKAELTSAGLYTSWTAVTPLSTAVSYPVVAVTKGKVYLIGGSIAVAGNATIYEASIQPDGTLGNMAVSLRTNPVTDARYSSCVVTRNHVYLLQAYDGTTNYLGRVYGAAIDADGNIGPWSIYFTRSTITKVDATVFVVKDKLYLMGGTDPTAAQPATRMFHTNFLGGRNDYSLYNNKPISVYQVPTKFYLPFVDKPALEGVSYYVKY